MRIDRAFGRKHSGALKVRDFDFEIKAVSDDGKFNGYGSVWDVVAAASRSARGRT